MLVVADLVEIMLITQMLTPILEEEMVLDLQEMEKQVPPIVVAVVVVNVGEILDMVEMVVPES